jgi:C4-dicarboxylate-specific signal transduction histidine kinase
LPRDPREWLIFTGEAVTLVLSVALASRITKDLRRQRGMLVRRNRRIRGMTKRLRHQQRAMVQHEKMVAVGQMAAGVAHEIANPLASMDSLLQLLQRKPEKLGPDKLVTLREQVERIHQIIQQMKVFAHPNEGNWQTVPLNDLVEQAINMVRFDLRLKTLQVVREFTPDAGSITVLPQAIHQVLVNLIINALDAMADVEQPRLTVRTARREGWCAIKVEDNGSGIQPEHMNRLFEPFFTTKPVGRGTGLGLSISYSLIRKQGGKIEVNSEVGRGAIFTISLPIDGRQAAQSVVNTR